MRLRTPQVTPHASTIREYKSGDSLNRIHWPTTARTERLMVKEFDQGVGGGVWLLLDMQKSAQAGSEAETTDEYGVTLAASVAKKHLEMGLPIGFLGYGEQRYFLPLRRGAGHLQQLMDQLARIKAEGTVPLHEVLLKEGDLFTRYTTLIVITPSLDPTWVSPLEILAGRRVKVVAMHLDAVSFGSRGSTTWASEALQRAGILTYVIGKGDNLSQAISLSKALSVHAQAPRRREVVG
ncbi:MAG: DUF58 domain-containing protein [Chloroflexi bacterium]|nr:DUF58 domain-containing protein [Chloroflexota bacterium]